MTLSSFYRKWISQSSTRECHGEIVIYSWIGWRGVEGMEQSGEREKGREGEWTRTLHSSNASRGLFKGLMWEMEARNWRRCNGQCSWPNHTLCRYFIQVSVVSSWGLPDKGMKQQEPRSRPPPRAFSELLSLCSFSPWPIFNLHCHPWGAWTFMTFIAF